MTANLVFPKELNSNSVPFVHYEAITYTDPWVISDDQQGASTNVTTNPNNTSASEEKARNVLFTCTLALPPEIKNDYKLDWEIENNPIISDIRDITKAMASGGPGNPQIGHDIVHGLGAIVFKELKLNRVAPIIANPRKQAIFNGISPREFKFTHIMIPNSLEEAQTVKQIFTLFTQNAMPSPTNSEYFFNFPSEWNISFEGLGSTNIFPKISVCVLTAISHNLTPKGLQFLEDGMPITVELELSFTETDLRLSTSPGV